MLNYYNWLVNKEINKYLYQCITSLHTENIVNNVMNEGLCFGFTHDNTCNHRQGRWQDPFCTAVFTLVANLHRWMDLLIWFLYFVFLSVHSRLMMRLFQWISGPTKPPGFVLQGQPKRKKAAIVSFTENLNLINFPFRFTDWMIKSKLQGKFGYI